MLGWILSVLGLGGLGALTYLVGPATMFGFLKPVSDFLARVPWYAYAAAALIGLLSFLFISRAHWIDRAHADEDRISSICQTTRDAAANPKLDCKDAEAQIKLLGQAVGTLKEEIARQNAKVDALGKQTEAEKQIAAKASKIAAQRAKEAEAVSERLAASSRSTPAPAASCAPSRALQEQWQ